MSDDVKLETPVATTTGADTPIKSAHLPFQKRRQLERDIEHITSEMYKRNKELAETNKTLSLLRTIDALALESYTTVNVVCGQITEAIAQSASYAFVGLLTRSNRNPEELVLNGWSSSGWQGKKVKIHFSRMPQIKMTNNWFGKQENTRLLSLDGLPEEAMADFIGCSTAEMKHMHKQLPLNSVYAIKLSARHRLVGLLVVGFPGPAEDVNQNDIIMLDRLSESIGVALDNKLLLAENQLVLRQIKESNAKLRALDEAKDDFISMASHQLRTPLTSVKGYISMIKEGDAGHVTPKEKQMLNQAFASSQRMVYLIADLLNVSRLRTGKFFIEPEKVNLASMISEEIEQINEIAKVASQKLIYTPPKNFPDLMLDDVKTRQVIMNFIDNSLHYTPTGGIINVSLVETPTNVELRIKDNGIGVPRSEQPHLFTKFYRAGNARKARPDGTGLGLFMAKKVIVAQGGSVIFESHEDKGSTFGFVFNKRQHVVPDSVPKKPTA
ncbi:MAG TPA: GAF domain-containing sensor histidine kinase [Candidatus Saccharimonadales bacterium]|nr:GAF domain-containing sensor histidine kinase [Candidatus Saccharimonadales bacterium]